VPVTRQPTAARVNTAGQYDVPTQFCWRWSRGGIEGDAAPADGLVTHFAPLADGAGMTALNAAAILGCDGAGTAGAARTRDIADDLAATFGPRVAAVLPVAPKLAQAATTNALTNADVAVLMALEDLDPSLRDHVQEALAAGHALAGAPVPLDEFERVYRKIGELGIRSALELGHHGRLTPASLTQHLREMSGIDELARQVSGLQLRADVLKASQALRALEKLSYRSGLSFLGDEIERLRFRGPAMELIGTVDAFARCVSGQVNLRTDKLSQLQTLLTGRTLRDRLGLSAAATDEAMLEAAMDQLRAWKAFEGIASPQERRVAGDVVDHYEAILTELTRKLNEGVA
jgi:hypothetical protein